MSHAPERKEKNCLNCGAEVYGLYCHICGQENREPRETVWGLITHFFYDITHFDGKFFSTLKYLVLRPGFLPREYLIGRRASYLNPVRMYVFTSAFFFLIFFSMFKVDEESMTKGIDKLKGNVEATDPNLDIDFISGDIKTKQGKVVGNINKLDSAGLAQLKLAIHEAQLKDSTKVKDAKKDSSSSDKKEYKQQYKTIEEYDSVQNTLPAAKRDGWFMRNLQKKNIRWQQKYGNDQSKMFAHMYEEFLHKLPTLLFISLPFFALFLKLLYVRKKDIYYVNHGIFSIHYYIFCFVTLLIFFAVMKMSETWKWGGWGFVKFVLWLSFFYYLYKAMRNFYQQGRAKTILKFIILSFLNMFLLIFLFIVFLGMQIFTV